MSFVTLTFLPSLEPNPGYCSTFDCNVVVFFFVIFCGLKQHILFS